MSTDVYTRISERMKKENFTEEEIRVVKKAKEQLSNYTKAKNFKGIQGLAIATGGFIVGSQLGLLLGAMSSVKTIQSIPNFQRILHIVQEVRGETEGHGAHGAHHQHHHTASFPSAGHQRFPVQQRGSELMTDDVVEQQSNPFQGFKDGDGYHGGNDPNSIMTRQDQSSAWAQAQQRAKELNNSSASWSQIRQQNMPKSAWNDVRDGRGRTINNVDQDNEEDAFEDTQDGLASAGSRKNGSQKPTLSGWDRVRQGDVNGSVNVGGAGAPDGPSDFARTREDLESRPSTKKNQYGDTF
ncbi:hypothetical protein BGX28_000665 [Mortierella sp. GBA30]|nr:hypothetical protein BGX28_000665 [Mortierella sp. GBA30]